ncbi:aldehyde dehydrogenase family protein [Diplocloster agilis]|uniref:Aldehyde dehydrogenase family protein n=1 Tax=Diplocloster agilis TaxID=2850323 RepID=A0A949JY49_9FIRM|nr:aldehyde dehydrogenase family protein [Diplocloster agilis]MBU9737345.1 aldehyde dehydrogenase family protein [Diplocloster agilis]
MKMLIDGEWVDSSSHETIPVLNPYTGEVLDQVPAAAREDVDRAIESAVKGQKKWNRLKIRDRAEILRAYLELLKRERDGLARLLTLETGKPIFDSYGEIDSVSMTFESSIEIVKHHYGKTMPMGIEGGYDDDLQITVHEPLGVIACIVPFNFPAALWAFKAGPALMAGNAIVVKPATSNPLTVLKLMGLLVEAGVTPEAVQCITGQGSKVGNWICKNPALAQVNVTGGVRAGIEIAKQAAEHLTSYKFELGGNDPLIICKDCDMDLAVNEAGDKTRNAGQCCSGAKRFIVHNSIKEEFVTRLIEERLKTVKTGDLLDINTDFGVLISEEAAKEVEKQVALTVEQGARLVYGGHRKGAFYEPTVLMNVTPDMDIAKDMEVFGPVYPIIGFDTLEEAIDIAERSHYGLSAGVITENFQDAMTVAGALRSGMVAVNGSGGFRAQELPFGGGKKMSGNSRECISSVLEEVTQEKSIIFRYAMKKFHAYEQKAED